MATVEIGASGHNEAVTVTGAKTLAATDQGLVQNVTATATVTLPAAAAGLSYLVRVGKEGITLTIALNGTDTLAGNSFTAASGKGAIATNQPGGSYVQVTCGATGAWNIHRQLGTWTRTP